MNRGSSASFIKAVATQWREDRISRLAAALAYYTFISAAATLVILMAVAAALLNAQQVEALLLAPLSRLLGDEVAPRLLAMTDVFAHRSSNLTTTVLSTFALLFSAARSFVALQDALNTLWGVKRPPVGIVNVIKHRFVAFTCVSVTTILLLVMWIGGTLLRTYAAVLPELVGSRGLAIMLLETTGSLLVHVVVFSILFKVLPSVSVAWRDVALGATLSAVLFWGVSRLLGYYVQASLLASAYGAAGSLVALLFWFYLAAQILLLGAKFSQVYAHQRGTHAKLAQKLREEMGAPSGEVVEGNG